MSNVNARQVGGAHYARGGTMQHWDYAVRALDNRYLESALTKYVMRHRHKGTPVQDLQKARHYLEKLSVEHAQGRIKPLCVPGDLSFKIHDLCIANELNIDESIVVKLTASWGGNLDPVEDLLSIDAAIVRLLDAAQHEALASDAAKATQPIRAKGECPHGYPQTVACRRCGET